MSENKSMKNKVILERMINETTVGDMDWIFIGTGIDDYGKKNIFMSFVNLYGSKNLILELLLYRLKNRNKLLIYMENSKTDDIIEIKEIKFSNKLTDLSHKVMNSVREYNDTEEYMEVHKFLKDKYGEIEQQIKSKSSTHSLDDNDLDSDYYDYKNNIAKLLYKKGDKKYWDEFVGSYHFGEYVIKGWEDNMSLKEVVNIIHDDHHLNAHKDKTKKLTYSEYTGKIVKLLYGDRLAIDDKKYLDKFINSDEFIDKYVIPFWNSKIPVDEAVGRIIMEIE